MKFYLFIIFLLPQIVLSHGTVEHKKYDDLVIDASSVDPVQEALKLKELETSNPKLMELNMLYQSSVGPIFSKKCANCHGKKTTYPWYYKIPGIKHLIDYDIREARSHLKMLGRFPFESHVTPYEDLTQLEETISSGSMPPWRYRLLHPESKINETDKAEILKWIEAAKEVYR